MTDTKPSPPPAYRFGEFELDCARRELRRAGQPVPIQPKAFELLRYLLEHRDRAVDKDELQDALWPRTIVTEASLTRSVMKARRAVGDDSERQAVIRTVHGHGYRFLPEIEPPGGSTEVAAAEGPPPRPATTARTAAPRWLSLSAAAALVVLLVTWWAGSRDVTAGPVRLAVLPIENATGDPELDWVGTGMMSLLSRLLESHGLEVVGERAVIGLAGNRSAAELAAPDSDFADRIRRTEGATHLLAGRLEAGDGVYRLQVTLTSERARPEQRTGVGAEATSMIPDVAATIAALVTDGRAGAPRARVVSADAFLNEAYARALSLEFAGRNEEAKRLFQVVVEQEPELFWPRYEVAICARNLREWEVAEPLLQQLAAEAGARGAIAEQSAALNSLGILYLNRDEFDLARPLFEDVLRLADGTPHVDRLVAANVNLGLVSTNTGDFESARDYFDRAIALVQRQGIESLPGTITNNLAGVLIRLGRLDEAEARSREAVANFRVTGNRVFEASALSRLSSVLRRQGRLAEAESAQELALSIRRELGNRSGEASSYLSLAALAVERGDAARARLYGQDAYEIGLEIQDRYLTGSALGTIADADRRLGRPADAEVGFAAAAAIFRDIGDVYSEHAVTRDLARCRLDLGDLGGARRLADELLAWAVERADRREEARARLLQAEILLAGEADDDATTLLEDVLAAARELGDRAIETEAALLLAGAYLDAGSIGDAEPLVARLAAERPGQPDSIRLKARLAHAVGDHGQAADLLESLRSASGDAWTEADAARLHLYREAAAAPGEPER